MFPRWDKFLIVLGFGYVFTYLTTLLLDWSSTYTSWLHSVIDYEILIIALSIPFVLIISLRKFGENKVLTYVIFPVQSLWAISFLLFSYRYLLGSVFGSWITKIWHPWETILLSCLVVSFSWVLLKRFSDLRKQLAQNELEREQEKSRLMETQKIVLEEQVMERTSELKQSLENLKSTQSQLIQSEKMASLGELTAGIAHEIQNPLNFVNNFSEVNSELLAEMKAEIEKGNYAEARAIAGSVVDNESKILYHGKRADAIVKSMLQHSRSSAGLRELTDINVLVDEYLRLAYHGLRARDKGFTATTKTEFGANLPQISVAPQDIGRAVLNLITNAFFAVAEKKKRGIEGFEPMVTVITSRSATAQGAGPGEVIIRVRDNGDGIPEAIRSKIFQPFFTTKPSGQGTGLGLSLCYDIVKTHGGDLSVESVAGDGTEFVVRLPIE